MAGRTEVRLQDGGQSLQVASIKTEDMYPLGTINESDLVHTDVYNLKGQNSIQIHDLLSYDTGACAGTVICSHLLYEQ